MDYTVTVRICQILGLILRSSRNADLLSRTIATQAYTVLAGAAHSSISCHRVMTAFFQFTEQQFRTAARMSQSRAFNRQCYYDSMMRTSVIVDENVGFFG